VPQSDFWLSMSELFGRVAAGISMFVDREIELAKLEASEDLRTFAKATQVYAAAAVFAVAALAMLLAAAVSGISAVYISMGLDPNVASGLAALSIAVVCAVLAWWLFTHARSIVRTVAKRLDRALSVFGKETSRAPKVLPAANEDEA
jgi:hypothetical protein